MMQFNIDRRPPPGYLPCLSIQQPYAEAIVSGKKSVELREWATSLRGPLLIHTGKKWYGQVDMGIVYALESAAKVAEELGLETDLSAYSLGAIVGIVTITGCMAYRDRKAFDDDLERHRNPGVFYSGTIGWSFTKQVKFDVVLPYRGERGMFSIPIEVVKLLVPDGYLEG